MADAHFLQALDELRALHISKGQDYADAADPLRNYTVSGADNGLPAWRAAQLRLSEKYHRLVNLTRGHERAPQHESVDDTLMDLAAMALIVRALRHRVAGPTPVPRVAPMPLQGGLQDCVAAVAPMPLQDADPGDERAS